LPSPRAAAPTRAASSRASDVAPARSRGEDRATAAYYSAAIGLDLDAGNRRIYVADTIRGLLVLEGTSALFP
jgi:hypothetical protein